MNFSFFKTFDNVPGKWYHSHCDQMQGYKQTRELDAKIRLEKRLTSFFLAPPDGTLPE